MNPQRMITTALTGAERLGTRIVGAPGTARAAEWTAGRLRYTAGVLDGIAYRARGHRPDPHVDDDVLADRVRTALGPVLKRLDLPRINVMVEQGVALLHGEVGTVEDANTVTAEVRKVPGVRDVRPSLHIGMDSGATRPSEGRAHHGPSEALARLRTAAAEAGVVPALEERTAAAVIRALLDRLPEGERGHVRLHLPEDARQVVDTANVPHTAREARTLDQYLSAVTAAVPPLGRDTAEAAAVKVLAELRRLVPEEQRDVAAVLPEELRQLWRRAEPSVPGS